VKLKVLPSPEGVDGRGDLLGVILGDEVLAALDAFDRCAKVVSEPVTVADLLESICRSPDQARRHVDVRDLVGEGNPYARRRRTPSEISSRRREQALALS
jgi:hypothetical protein